MLVARRRVEREATVAPRGERTTIYRTTAQDYSAVDWRCQCSRHSRQQPAVDECLMLIFAVSPIVQSPSSTSRRRCAAAFCCVQLRRHTRRFTRPPRPLPSQLVELLSVREEDGACRCAGRAGGRAGAAVTFATTTPCLRVYIMC